MLARLLRSLQPRRAAKMHDEALARWRRNDVAGAEQAFRRALALDPGLMAAWSNLGLVLREQGRPEEAIACLDRAIELAPASAVAQFNLAVALMSAGGTDGALAHFREAIRLEPSLAQARATILKPLLDRCDWDGADEQAAALVELCRRDPGAAAAVPPFLALHVAFGPELRLAIARANAAVVRAKVESLPRPARAAGGARSRIRVGYVSADLHKHAVALTAVRMLELHDCDRFETFAYAFGVAPSSKIRRRIEAAFEHVVDVRGEPFDATARRIAADGIDVLVDLMGYTAAARPELFALRPAPAQVAFLGFAGTTGADCIDAIVADRFVVPAAHERWYSERVVRLPATFFPVDDRRTPPRPARRAEFGLPEDAFVFCSFGVHGKIERDVFACWLRILMQVPGSLLWLSGGPAEAQLQRAAADARVDPARLRFAARLPDESDYLGRLRTADLFLDTRTYNAHSTGADALWAGVPLLTVLGDGFAGRVGASLANAVGMRELVATDLADYEARAVGLAADPGRLRALRAALDGERARLPLYDCARHVRELEALFEDEVARARATRRA